MYLDRQGTSALHPLPSPSHNLDKAFLRMARPSTHLALPQVMCCHTKIGLELSAIEHNCCHTSNIRSLTTSLEMQVFCLHVGLNLTVGKEFFNEIQSHIILYPFYIQHCVGKTWRGWGPSLLVDRAFRRKFSTN
jgi:hypothetical protein